MADVAADKKGGDRVQTADELNSLRTLILAPEQQEITELKERLDDPQIRAEELSRIIAEAIVIRAGRDRKLATALLPTIEEVIRDSVKRDPKFLADTIFPIIGPAIRRSIAESLRAMVQSMSDTLEHTFSWRGIQWRIESFRTGRSFAETVLMHTLVYRMEQLFLIHKETGLVLQHVAAESIDLKDADMVSAMLTAIQDFVNDSFSAKEDSSLQNLNMGELTIWIEQGPRTLLASVIRGNPPAELKTVLKEILENIEFEYNPALEDFKGDAAPFDLCKPDLTFCLTQAQKTDSRSNKATDAPAKIREKKQKTRKGQENIVLFIYIAAALCIIIIIVGFILSMQ
jgi:OOP family OmpA-OmpF porin